MTHLLDTDTLSVLQVGKGAQYAVLVANLNLHPDGDVGVSVVTFHEQARGCHNKVNAAKSPAQVVRGYELFLQLLRAVRLFPTVPFDHGAAVEFDKLLHVRKQVGTMDLRIACTALVGNLTLVTRNTADFSKVPNLKITDWTR
jgi:tRNA(fMet)-specific endonuclease VapC